MRKILLTISSVFLLGTATVIGQQDRALTHFIYDKMSFNPAATGVKPGYCGTLIYRNQWDKFIGAPNSFVFNAEGNFANFNSGIGVTFAHDAIGFQRTNKFYLNYAYHLPLRGIGGILSFGAGLGMINVGFTPEWITPSGAPPQNDPSLGPSGEKTSATTFDMNLGVMFSGKQGNNDYWVGISTTHLTGLQLKNINYKNSMHFVVMGGYMINFGSSGWAVEPNVIVQTDFVKTSVNINALAYWKKKLRFGLGYRIPESLGILVGWKQPIGSNMAIDIGYSYDITTNSTIATYSKGSHEIMLKFCWIKPPKPVEPTRNPRWL